MTTRNTAAEIEKAMAATVADIKLCRQKRRYYDLDTQSWLIYDSLLAINEDVLKWQECRLQDIN